MSQKSFYGNALAIGSFLIYFQILMVFLSFAGEFWTTGYDISDGDIPYIWGALSIGLTALAGGVLGYISRVLRQNSRPSAVLCATFLLLMGTAFTISPWHSSRMFSEGRSKHAIANYSERLAANPQDGALYYNRAYEYLNLRQYDNAWRDYYAAKRLGQTINPIFVKMLEETSGRKATE